jgi:hypothetical protein
MDEPEKDQYYYQLPLPKAVLVSGDSLVLTVDIAHDLQPGDSVTVTGLTYTITRKAENT